MFKELAPYLRQRAVLLTVTHIEDDQIRVNVIPQKLKDGENAALTLARISSSSSDSATVVAGGAGASRRLAVLECSSFTACAVSAGVVVSSFGGSFFAVVLAFERASA